jgi:serine/threonine protein kinase
LSTTLRRLAQYELLHQLGKGNVGEVWQACDLSLHRDVALKLFHPDLQRHEAHFLTRLTNEGQALVTLRHPNIVPVHEVKVSRLAQSQETTAYLVMDYIQGQTFADYLRITTHTSSFPALTDIIYLFTSLGQAIDYAHQQSMVHGNIKPDNILLNKHNTTHFKAGEPLLTDFGLMQLAGMTGNTSNPFYISPEQAQGFPATSRSDIYALGVILYELCTGIVPFRDENPVAVMMQHIHRLPTPPMLINTKIPPGLSAVILRAMAKDPFIRFPKASLLAAAIADASSSQSAFPIGKPFPFDNETRLNTSPKISSLPGITQPHPQTYATTSENSSKLKSLPSLPTVPSPAAPSLPPTAPSQKAQPPTNANTVTRMSTVRISVPVSQARQPEQGPVVAYYPPQGKNEQPSPTQHPPQSLTARAHPFSHKAPGYIIFASLLILVLVLGSAIGISLLLHQEQPPANTNGPGQLFFQDDALGQNDQLRIDMQNIPDPPSGKSYFAWLQNTNGDVSPLGALTTQNGHIAFTYAGNSIHTNLLATMQGLFITTEAKGSEPQIPNENNKIYQASFDSNILAALKNILYQTPGLPDNGSITNEMLDVIRSINDKAASINDSLNHDNGLVIRQASRIIDMLDSSAYAAQSGDRPATVPSELNAQIGLLSSPTQPGYLDILDQQLQHLRQASENAQHSANTSQQLQHIRNVENAVTDLHNWLQNLRTYDVQLLKATNLSSPAILSTVLQLKQTAADSYTGRTIPPNIAPQPTLGSAGASQAYTEAQYLAMLDIQPA